MQLHQLRPKARHTYGRRIGRGGKRGTYSGRGIKGQKSRAGRKLQPIIRQLIKRYPKLRGYRFKSKIKDQRSKIIAVNLDVLEEKFSEGEKITPGLLVQKRIIRKIKGKMPQIKILGKGEIKRSFMIEGCLVSKQAKEKIEKAGGKVK